MPKATRNAKYTKAARAAPTTKTLSFIFEGTSRIIAVSQHDAPATIMHAFRSAVGASDIEVANDNGIKLQLGYNHLKNNGKVFVQHAKPLACPPAPSPGHSESQVEVLLEKVVALWELDSVLGILPAGAPRAKILAGQAATAYDTSARLLHPVEWTMNFASALHDVARLNPKEHQKALEMLMSASASRLKNKEHRQHHVAEIMTQDVLAVAKDLKESGEMVELADNALNALNAATSIKWTGELGDALERVEEGMDVEGREEDPEGTHFVLPLRSVEKEEVEAERLARSKTCFE